jgi:hypothetical protein
MYKGKCRSQVSVNNLRAIKYKKVTYVRHKYIKTYNIYSSLRLLNVFILQHYAVLLKKKYTYLSYILQTYLK